MKLTEALRILQSAPAGAPEFEVLLACSFTPLHLQTFLGAHLQQELGQGKRVRIDTGLFGDLAGSLERAAGGKAEAIAIALEWPDVDARLGYRQLGGWGPAEVADIAANADQSLDRIRAGIEKCPAAARIAISLPTLALPPAFHTHGGQAGAAELSLRSSLANFARCLGLRKNVHVISEDRLWMASAPGTRFDLKSELLTGLPYTISHADALGAALSGGVLPRPPKKGLITDLDDTLWSGIVGEVGPGAVTWDLTSHTQLHGLYQQLLRALAERGVLIGIASKNDSAVVEKALAREDILLPQKNVFPVEVHWEPKSGSVARILRAWNIGADSVVFVDDSPMELGEVKAAHPEVECIRFPKDDYKAAQALFEQLRDWFGKSHLSEEDSYRLESLRQGAAFQNSVEQDDAGAREDFLAKAEAKLVLDFAGSDPRVLELVNKTNQFNLNGVRYTEAEWQERLQAPGAFVLAAAYQDKFGPLGKIAVMQGQREGRKIQVNAWVMSCRAFARRIEHACLNEIFRRFDADEVQFSYVPTAKNGPLRTFLEAILEQGPEKPAALSRERFTARLPKLYHTISENHE